MALREHLKRAGFAFSSAVHGGSSASHFATTAFTLMVQTGADDPGEDPTLY